MDHKNVPTAIDADSSPRHQRRSLGTPPGPTRVRRRCELTKPGERIIGFDSPAILASGESEPDARSERDADEVVSRKVDRLIHVLLSTGSRRAKR